MQIWYIQINVFVSGVNVACFVCPTHIYRTCYDVEGPFDEPLVEEVVVSHSACSQRTLYCNVLEKHGLALRAPDLCIKLPDA